MRIEQSLHVHLRLLNVMRQQIHPFYHLHSHPVKLFSIAPLSTFPIRKSLSYYFRTIAVCCGKLECHTAQILKTENSQHYFESPQRRTRVSLQMKFHSSPTCHHTCTVTAFTPSHFLFPVSSQTIPFAIHYTQPSITAVLSSSLSL